MGLVSSDLAASINGFWMSFPNFLKSDSSIRSFAYKENPIPMVALFSTSLSFSMISAYSGEKDGALM